MKFQVSIDLFSAPKSIPDSTIAKIKLTLAFKLTLFCSLSVSVTNYLTVHINFVLNLDQTKFLFYTFRLYWCVYCVMKIVLRPNGAMQIRARSFFGTAHQNSTKALSLQSIQQLIFVNASVFTIGI